MKKAVILLSGGLDSATCLYWARNKGYKSYCLIFNYGQRHKKEIKQAIKIAKHAKCPYQLIKISLPWKGSSLLDKKMNIPSAMSYELPAMSIPSTYVPARNTIFLSFAISYAESIGAEAIVIGTNAIDFSGYPDCRPQYYNLFRKVAILGTKRGIEKNPIKILTPLINKTKAQIIKLGKKLKVPYELTWSCYRGGRKPCGKCDSCVLRAKGFRQAGLKDPAFRILNYEL